MAATSRFDPDAVAAASFPVARRGYDTDEVRTYLQALGAEVARLHRACDDLRAELAARPTEVGALDEATVAQALGQEAARLLTTAREAAAQIRARSEEAAASLVDEANQDAARTRQEADIEAARLRQDAQAQAAAEVDAAKAEGREMVNEARAVRERMLADVQRRREQARSQLEQLRLGHERVLGTFELAAEALAGVTADLRALAPDVRRTSAVDTGPVAVVPPVAVRVSVPVRPPSEPVVGSEPPEPPYEPPYDGRSGHGEDPDADDAASRPSVLVSTFSLGEVAEVADADEAASEPEPGPVVEQPASELVEPELVDEADAVIVDDVDVAQVDEVDALVIDEPAEDDRAALAVEIDEADETGDAALDLISEATDEETVEAETVEAVAPEPLAPEPLAPEPEPVVAAEAEHDMAFDEDAAHEHDPAHPRPSADDLFARIRAARAAVTAETSQPSPSAPTAPEPEHVRATVLLATASAAEVIAERNTLLVPVEAALARRFKRALADEQNEVLDRLRRKNPVLTLDGLVGTLDDHAGAYERLVRDEAGAAVRAGARSLRADLDDAGIAAAVGREVVDSLTRDTREQLVAPLRERLARLLEHSGDAAAVTDGVRLLYREWKTQKLDELARHLAVAAHGRAAYAVLVPGTPVCWAVDPTRECPDGDDNVLGGVTAAGDAFPTGHRSAPAYVGCRCALAPAAG